MVAQTLEKGYKQTEIGVIPEDWEIDTLQNLSEEIMVGIASAATHAYREKGVVLFRNQNIRSCKLDDSDILFIDEEFEQAYVNKKARSWRFTNCKNRIPWDDLPCP